MKYPGTALCVAMRCVFTALAAVTVGVVCASSAGAAGSVVDDQQRAATRFVEAGAMSSPGIPMGITSYDMQHHLSQGHQVANTPGASTVHFCWTLYDHIPDWSDASDRFIQYNSWDVTAGSWNQGLGGTSVSLSQYAHAGYVRVDVDKDNLATATFHQGIEENFPYHTWFLFFPVEGSGLHLDHDFGAGPDECHSLWPDVAVGQSPSTPTADVWHVIATWTYLGPNTSCSWTNRLGYWRYDAGAPVPAWEGPAMLDTSGMLGHVIDADDNSGKVAVAFHPGFWRRVWNVAYRESHTAGAGWIDGSELGDEFRTVITAYEDTLGPEAYGHISVAYDHAASLNIVWDERRIADSVPDIGIKHWSNIRGTIETVTLGYYPNAGTYLRDLNLSKITLGIGDGSTLCNGGAESNQDYLYVVYSKLGGETPEEQADVSALGYANSELYLTVSHDGGTEWSTPVNLTNTKTPGCSPSDPETPGPGDCASEHWATIARTVDDINIFYILDREAEYFGYTPWTINPVMYLQIPGGGTDTPLLCPDAKPIYAATLADPGPSGYVVCPGRTGSATLWLFNTGGDVLTGSIDFAYTDPASPPAEWLSVADPAYSVPPDDSVAVVITLDASQLPPGDYTGEVHISHNDHQQVSPGVLGVSLSVLGCLCHGDPVCDGVTNVLDVVTCVDEAFRDSPPQSDPDCPSARSDVTCDGVINVLDVVKIVNVAFRGGDPETEFCDPCVP